MTLLRFLSLVLLFSSLGASGQVAKAQQPSSIPLSQTPEAGNTKALSRDPIQAPVPIAAAPIVFENAIGSSKIKFTLNNTVSSHRYSIETMTGGVAAFDFDNDGWLDLFFTNGAELPSLEKANASFSNRLFHNNGDGTFTDVTAKAGLAGIGYSMGASAGDFDNDGREDLYVTGVNHNQLFHNNGDGTFTDVTARAGVSGLIPGIGKAWAVTAGWLDYNNDGL
ncbi:MAG: FG-GAP repeat domain-containing protein, partial [Janthinobacterium lividum]